MLTRYKILLLTNFISEECFIFTAIAATLAVAGMFMQREGTRNAAKQAEYDAEYEAEVAETQAEQEKLNRREAEKGERKMTARRRASQRASYAKSGVLLEGTPLTMLSEQASADELNIQQSNAESRQRRVNLLAGGQNALIAGRNKSNALKYKANTQFIGSAASAMGSGAKWWDSNKSSEKSDGKSGGKGSSK